jgi:hypothetical protein
MSLCRRPTYSSCQSSTPSPATSSISTWSSAQVYALMFLEYGARRLQVAGGTPCTGIEASSRYSPNASAAGTRRDKSPAPTTQALGGVINEYSLPNCDHSRDQPDSSNGQDGRRCNATATARAFSLGWQWPTWGRAHATIRAGRVDVPPSRPPGPKSALQKFTMSTSVSGSILAPAEVTPMGETRWSAPGYTEARYSPSRWISQAWFVRCSCGAGFLLGRLAAVLISAISHAMVGTVP